MTIQRIDERRPMVKAINSVGARTASLMLMTTGARP